MDLLNVAGDEGLDLGDLTYATNAVPTGLLNELTGNFLLQPGTASIVTGLRPSGSGQGPVQVGDNGVPNVAFLGQRQDGIVTQGVFTLSGPAVQQVSVSSLPANTYGIFVRFNRLPGQTQSRKFWAKAAPGREYSQLQSTRLVATWEARVEVSAPSSEWVKIGQVVVTSAGTGQGSTISVTDQRLLYFEGPVAGGYAPSWGSAADRSNDRTAANTSNLQRQLDALRQCILDIKGRGLATWYQPNISGLQVGTGYQLSSSPTANTVAVGDDGFALSLRQASAPSGTLQPTILLDGTNDYLAQGRAFGSLFRVRLGKQLFANSNAGVTSVGVPTGLTPGMLTAFQGGLTGMYGLAAVTTASNLPASLGLVSTTANAALVELGNGYGQNAYGQIYVTWANNVAFNLTANQYTFLTATSSTQGSPPTIDLTASRLNINTTNVVVNNRQTASGGAVFAAGYVSVNNFDPSQISMPPSTVVSGQNTGGTFILVFNSAAFPNPAIVSVTPMRVTDGKAHGVSVSQVSTQITVSMRNDNAEPALTDFSIIIYWGAS